MSSAKKRTTLQSKHEKGSIVEKIVSRRKRNRKLYYLVKWQGCDESENSWELAENLDCTEMMRVYEENRKIEFRKRLSLRQYKSRMPNAKEEIEDVVKSEKGSSTDEMDKENSGGNKTDLNLSPTKFEVQTTKDNANKQQKEAKIDEEITKDTERLTKGEDQESDSKEITVIESNTDKQKSTSKTSEILKDDLANINTTPLSEEKTEFTISTTNENHKQDLMEKSNEKSYEIIGDKYLVTDFLNRESVQTGFEKGLEVERIIGATKVRNNLYLVLKFHEENEPQLIVADIVKEKIPQMVIQFYESCLTWESDDEEMKI